MTPNNLSRKLCEISGIEAKIIEDYNGNEYKIFPDITQPENFVKLLKIANDVLGSVDFVTAYTKNKPNLFEEQAIMHYMPIAKLNDNFKQAIKSEVWKYE